ncbi:unnamed protein product [Candidula unifasciata]|uniref:Phosphatidic acid phosphatase type 2/haloperoxidase domain-containing protein n=1 Tax=Candidula unifasciata TaxID=100452 RepID=A0A8S3ZIW8_9EUPU|nr:unnamed protein product [Candidula unifasciata]
MTSSGHRLLEVLSDSNLTAKFQQFCGIRSHIFNTSANGSHRHAGETDRLCSLNGDKLVESTGSPDSKLVSDNDSLHLYSSNHNNHISNGLLKERGVHRKNGYRNGFIKTEVGDQVTNDEIVEDIPQKNGKNSTQISKGKAGEHDERHASIVCTQPYTLDCPILYYIFCLGAGLGNELFYILFFSTSLWNFDSLVIRKVLCVWCVIMYMGQAAKDIIRWPRPRSPPVVRLEERYELEFGMPSTHAMVGIAIPFGVIVFMSGRYEFNCCLGVTCAVIWSLLVSLSRLYLGMHSVLLWRNSILLICLMSATVFFVDPVDSFLMTHPWALPVTVVLCIILSMLYPSLEKWSTARGDTTMVLGVFSGIYAGMWLTAKLTEFDYVPDSPPYVLELPSVKDFSLGVTRQISGLFIIIIFLTLIKLVILHSLSWLFGYDPKDPRTKQCRPVELPYKYVSYYVSAAATTYIIPLLFLKLNIERPSYYSEVFSL